MSVARGWRGFAVSVLIEDVFELAAETAFLGNLGIAFQHLDELVGIGGVILVDTAHVEATKAEGIEHGLTVGGGINAILSAKLDERADDVLDRKSVV